MDLTGQGNCGDLHFRARDQYEQATGRWVKATIQHIVAKQNRHHAPYLEDAVSLESVHSTRDYSDFWVRGVSGIPVSSLCQGIPREIIAGDVVGIRVMKGDLVTGIPRREVTGCKSGGWQWLRRAAVKCGCAVLGVVSVVCIDRWFMPRGILS
jgi:hypothetical protein